MNAGADDHRIPAKVSLSVRPMVTAGDTRPEGTEIRDPEQRDTP